MSKKKNANKKVKRFNVPIKVQPDVQITAKPVLDASGSVIMRSIDDDELASVGSATKLKAIVDKDTGVLTMVLIEND